MRSERPTPINITVQTTSTRTQRYFAKSRGVSFEARSVSGKTVIDIFDEIGDFGVSTGDFSDQLKAASGDIVLRINSPGGDVFAGIAIMNMVLAHPGHVRVEVIGVAASAASIIAMAGDEIAIADGSFLMIHRAWGVTIGNRGDHDEASELLGKIDHSLARTYAKRTGQDIRSIVSFMSEETWFDAKSALANGFCTEIIEPTTAQARFDVSVYAKAPAQLRGVESKIDPDDINIRDLENILRDAGIPRRKAKALAGYGIKATADQRDADDDALDDLAAYFAATATNIANSLRNSFVH